MGGGCGEWVWDGDKEVEKVEYPSHKYTVVVFIHLYYLLGWKLKV